VITLDLQQDLISDRVLDKHWAEKAEQFQRTLKVADLLTHDARIFRVGDIEEFLTRFETDDYPLVLPSPR
jgi:hypothetical protein